MSNTTDLLTTGEVADLLGVSAETVRRWFHCGYLDAIVYPSGQLRFRPEHIDELLAQGDNA